MSMVRYSRKELNEKFSDKQDAEIQRLLAKGTVPDDQLDLSDIPENYRLEAMHTPQSILSSSEATKHLFVLDADVLAWFKAQGKGYQTRIKK